MAIPDGELPTRDNCDLRDPEEAFLWMLVAQPGIQGAPLPYPIEYLRQVSKRLWDCGARPTNKQKLWYHPPRAGDISPMFAAGEWKDYPPDPDDVLNVDLASLSKVIQDKVRQQAREMEPEVPAEVETAKVSAPPQWPAQMKVHALAKRIGASSKEILDVCVVLGVAAKSAQSLVPGNRCAAIRDQVRIRRAQAAAPDVWRAAGGGV